jgi:molecular chaperone GrpE
MNCLKNSALSAAPKLAQLAKGFSKTNQRGLYLAHLNDVKAQHKLYYTATRNFWKKGGEEKGEKEEESKTEEEAPSKTKSSEKSEKNEGKQEPEKKESSKKTKSHKAEDNHSEDLQEGTKELLKKREEELKLKSKAIEELTNSLKIQEKASDDSKKKIKEFRDALAGQIEELELVRKRYEKQLEDAKVYAIGNFAKDLVEVPDNLHRAIEAGAKEYDGKNHDFYDGVKATYHILMKTLEKHGIKRVHPLKEEFNPHFHEALFDYEDPTQKAGTVGTVAATGYTIGNRVLKSAKVGVIRKSENSSADNADDKSKK